MHLCLEFINCLGPLSLAHSTACRFKFRTHEKKCSNITHRLSHLEIHIKGVLQKCTQYKSLEGERKLRSYTSVYCILSGDRAESPSAFRKRSPAQLWLLHKARVGSPLAPSLATSGFLHQNTCPSTGKIPCVWVLIVTFRT